MRCNKTSNITVMSPELGGSYMNISIVTFGHSRFSMYIGEFHLYLEVIIMNINEWMNELITE